MEKVLLQKKTEGTVYAGFQKVSWLKIFGTVFNKLPKNHSLTDEWFLVIDKPLSKSMMVAYDMDGFETDDLKDRNFKGAKSTNPNTVKQAVELLESVVSS